MNVTFTYYLQTIQFQRFFPLKSTGHKTVTKSSDNSQKTLLHLLNERNLQAFGLRSDYESKINIP